MSSAPAPGSSLFTRLRGNQPGVLEHLSPTGNKANEGREKRGEEVVPRFFFFFCERTYHGAELILSRRHQHTTVINFHEKIIFFFFNILMKFFFFFPPAAEWQRLISRGARASLINHELLPELIFIHLHVRRIKAFFFFFLNLPKIISSHN